MKKYVLIFALLVAPVLLGFQAFTTFQYLVTGGITTRTDPNRWIDNWREVTEAGVDCTGTNDVGTALQAAIDAMPDAGTLKFPVGCTMKLGTGKTTGQCALTITDRVGVQFVSDVRVGNFGGGQTPTINWVGSGGTAFCFNHSDHPRIIGLSMQVSGAGNYDSCMVFDGNPSSHIGTAAIVDSVVCNNGSNTNDSFVGISISPTATNNHENYEISNVYLSCGSGSAALRARDGVTSAASKNVSSATAAFVSGDAGKVVTISYAGGFLTSTIATVTDGTHIVLADNVVDSETNVSVHIGAAHGVGLQNGASQNALQQTFRRVTYSNCNYGIKIFGGNAEMDHINGGFSTYGIWLGGFVAEQISINWYESENDCRGIESHAPQLAVTNSRMSNGAQFADGFFKFTGKVLLQSTNDEFAPPTNGVLIARNTGELVVLVSMLNNFQASSWNSVGYGSITSPPVTSVADGIVSGAPGSNVFGCWLSGGIPCVYVNNYTGHEGGVGIRVNSTVVFSDVASPVIGIDVTDTLGMGVGTYNALQLAEASAGIASISNVALKTKPAATPSSSSATCAAGETQWDSGFVYVCVAANTWKRATLTTF